ncbi:MAG: cytochrome b [Xanthobacteraceae bacterium]
METKAFQTKAGFVSRASEPKAIYNQYDALEIAFHWATVILVITLYCLAYSWSLLKRGTPLRLEMQALHVSLGICLAAILILRIVWRIGPGRRLPLAASGIAELAAKLVQYALYLLLLAVVSLGFCFRWSQQDPLSFFGLFVIPSPFAFSRSEAPLIGVLHYWVATTIIILALGHAFAALFHHYVLHDGVLRRMLPVVRSRQSL